MWVQGEIGDGPEGLLTLLAELHALGDGVLVGAREGREDQVTGVGLAVAHGHTGELLIEFHRLGHVREVQLRVHPVGEQVHGHGDDVHVAGALPIAEEGALDALSPCQQGQLPGGHGGAPVVVGVDGDNDVLPAVEMLAHVLNLLGIDVGHGHLHGGGEVDDDLPFRPGLPDVDDRVADPQGKLHLRASEALRGVFKAEVGLGHFIGVLVEQLGPGDSDVHDLVLRHPEDLLPLGKGGGVVEMDHHILGAFDGLKGFLNDVGAGLGEHLDVHIVGDQMVLDDGPQKFILGLGGGGEAYLNLFEPHVQQEAVKGQLFLQIHGGDQGLVAVPQVHAAPGGGLSEPVLLDPVHTGFRGHVIPRAVLFKVFHGKHDPFRDRRRG